MGNEGFEPSKARGQQIYSLSPLTAWVIPLFVCAAEPNLSTPRASTLQSDRQNEPRINQAAPFRPNEAASEAKLQSQRRDLNP